MADARQAAVDRGQCHLPGPVLHARRLSGLAQTGAGGAAHRLRHLVRAGFQFVADHCTDGFFGGITLDAKKAASRRIKEVASTRGRTVRTHTLVSLIQGDTDADAQRRFDHYQAGADVEAIANVYNLRVRDKDATQSEGYRERFESSTRLFYGGVPFVAGPERIAAMVEELAVDGQVDGVMFVFPDFVDGLTRFGEQVMPLLRQRGVLEPAPLSALGANGHA